MFRRKRNTTPPAQPRTESTVTVEDLLQFKKRAEQPSPEFWADFSHQLKQRQIAAAIQKKQSWWHALPRIAIAIPAGATAAIAIGLIVWRNAPPAAAPAVTAAQALPEAKTAAPAIATLATVKKAPAIRQAKVTHQPVVATAQPQKPARQTAAEAAVEKPVAPEHLETARTVFTANTASLPNDNSPARFTLFGAKSQTTKTVASAAFLSTPVALTGELLHATVEYATANAEPAASVSQETADPRRARLLTYTDNTIPVATTSTDNPRVARLRERVTSRFDDKALSDSISRIATTGDSLTIKF
ncbi:hypothetical protein M2103_000580 [Ereboglobus sp. PH5-5]|uniref:hypothetical protein n=1 Tax=Ereboglobus sp. PH5-5 TaxID=2940529 RepID=UPI0024071B5C|nr:hypothetical protein [Ereboglobus sp. PH5-5]MDF9832370.1 hypothetical protein [Ereboglobus sp. PH5-5]